MVSLLIARSCTHDIYTCVVVLAEDLVARALKSSGPRKAPGSTTRANARPTYARRATGLAETTGAGRWCRANRFRRKTRGVFITGSKAIFNNSSQCLTSCVSLLYWCTSIDIVDGRRGQNEKCVIMTTRRPEPQPKPSLEWYGVTSAWMLWLSNALG